MQQLARDALAQLLQPLARGAPLTSTGIGMAQPQLVAGVLIEQVHLVEDQQPRPLARADLLERLLDRMPHDARLLLGRGGVENVREQIGAAGLLERRREGVDELVGQLADEADRVGQQVRPAAQAQRAGRRVERVEQPVAHAHLGAGERVQQRRLAGVGVADQRDRRQRGALALGALDRARALHVLQAAAQRRDPVAREAPIGLDLRLPGSPRADPATEPLEVAPQAAHAREVVFELGELDLQLSLRAARVGGEDVEDHGRAVDDRQADGLLEVALLARGQLVVAGDQVGVAARAAAFASATLPGPR